MKTMLPRTKVVREGFVDAREAAYTMNLPMYYLTNARQRNKQRIPHYRIGRLVRFKLSELAEWQRLHGSGTSVEVAAEREASDE